MFIRAKRRWTLWTIYYMATEEDSTTWPAALSDLKSFPCVGNYCCSCACCLRKYQASGLKQRDCSHYTWLYGEVPFYRSWKMKCVWKKIRHMRGQLIPNDPDATFHSEGLKALGNESICIHEGIKTYLLHCINICHGEIIGKGSTLHWQPLKCCWWSSTHVHLIETHEN